MSDISLLLFHWLFLWFVVCCVYFMCCWFCLICMCIYMSRGYKIGRWRVSIATQVLHKAPSFHWVIYNGWHAPSIIFRWTFILKKVHIICTFLQYTHLTLQCGEITTAITILRSHFVGNLIYHWCLFEWWGAPINFMRDAILVALTRYRLYSHNFWLCSLMFVRASECLAISWQHRP